MTNKIFSRSALVLGTLAAATVLSACAPLIVGGAAVGSALMVTDRRTSGTQVEDEAIELKAANRIGQVLGDRGHVNVTSYNRMVLITGEVPAEADRDLSLRIVLAALSALRTPVTEPTLFDPPAAAPERVSAS